MVHGRTLQVAMFGAAVAAILSVVSAVGPANSGIAPGRTAPQARLQPGQVDVVRSRVFVFVDKSGFGHQHGVEGRLKSGHISLGASTEAGELVFDLASFVADTPSARRYLRLRGNFSASTQRKVTANMLGPKVLDVRRYPRAVFDIDSTLPLKTAQSKDAALYRLKGYLTLHGIRRPVIVDVRAVPERDRIRLRGKFSLRQTDYGIKPFSMAFGTVGIADRLTIYGEILIAAPAQLSSSHGAQRR